MKNPVGVYSTGEVIQAVTVHEPFVAVACGTFVQILRVDGDVVTIECNLDVRQGNSSSFTATDVAFNPITPERLAVATTNGVVVVFNTSRFTSTTTTATTSLASPVLSSSSNRAEEWRYADESSRAIHKLAWHHTAVDLLAAACPEGMVKIFDVRLKTGVSHYCHADLRILIYDPIHI